MKTRKFAKEILDFSVALTISVSIIGILHFFNAYDFYCDFVRKIKNKV